MNEEKRSLKDEAQKALIQREWTRALEVLQEHCARKPEDFRSRLKIAELLERLGQRREAIQVYQEVAEAYAQEGFLSQAISINKMILRIDSSSQDAKDRLGSLYEAKTFRPFRSIPLFSDLDEEELRLIIGAFEAESFAKEATICRDGEKGDSVFIIRRGEVAIIKEVPGEREVRVCTLGEGDFFGEFGFFTDHRRHATVKAVSECELLKFTRGRLEEMIKMFPRIGEVLRVSLKKRFLNHLLVLSPLFSTLTIEERDAISGRFQPRRVPEGNLIFKGGDPPLSLYVVKSGEVEIYTENRQGKRVHLAALKAGDLFGEISVLFGKPRTAYARATRPLELLELTRGDLEAYLAEFPKLQSKLKRIASERLAHTKEVFAHKEAEKVRETLV